MSSTNLVQKWRVHVRNLEIMMRVGCAPEEREPQRVQVSVIIEGVYPVRPQRLDECINYDLVYQLVAKQWPNLPHTILLETRITELLEYIFRSDSRVQYAKVALLKPDIFPEVEAVGLEAEWTRADFERVVPGGKQ